MSDRNSLNWSLDDKDSQYLDAGEDKEADVSQASDDDDVKELYYGWRRGAEGSELGDDEGGKGGIRDAANRDQVILGLDSYVSLASTAQYQTISRGSGDSEGGEEALARFSTTLGIPGVARLDLQPLTQKIIGCVVDENVTTEYPWLYVRKEIIEDNIDLHSESSDFLAVRHEIESYPGNQMLIGYAPSLEQKGQFYLCTTEESRAEVARQIDEQRLEQQRLVRDAVMKRPGSWCSLGSEQVIDETIVKSSRPLYEVEIESSINQLKAPIRLSDRTSDNQRDGYVELVPHRESFTNVMKVVVDQEAEVIALTRESASQTAMALRVNSSCQCSLDKEPKAQPDTFDEKQLKNFLQDRLDDVCEQIVANSKWDVYANDYAKLEEVGGGRADSVKTAAYEEHQSFFDARITGGKVINDLAWHPQLSGVAAVAYTTTSKSENLVGPKQYDQHFEGMVLIWSLDDCLKPKLILESKRQVTAVSFCPTNGNIVVGGCSNGQIVMWDTTGKIEDVETVVVRTAAQVKHATLIKSLTTWMKEPSDSSIVAPTVTSSLQYSQKGAITGISWLPPYQLLDAQGRLQDLPEDTEESGLSLQFVASSHDGSIAVYDLNWRPPEDKKVKLAKKKKGVVKPEGLAQSISPFKVLDGIFKPVYELIVQYEGVARNMVVTSMSLRDQILKKKQLEPKLRLDDDIIRRRYYKIVFEKKEPIRPEIFVGTSIGECGVVTWEGFEFKTGVTLNKEVCKWLWRKQVHDGPVTNVVRSPHLRDVLMTIGGRVFAVWREDFEDPVLWRKSDMRYTACCWDTNEPTTMIFGRNDGTVEIWDLIIKSHEPHISQSLSGRIITGVYAHLLPLNPQCIGFCDYNGALRIFLTAKIPDEFKQTELEWMRQFIDREVTRIKDFKEWQKEFKELDKIEGEEDEQKGKEKPRESKLTKIPDEEVEKMQAAKKAKAEARKTFVEQMRQRWVNRELKRMERSILTKKGLREEELERRLQPVLKMKREQREREQKRAKALEHADELFEGEVLASFPYQAENLLNAMSLPPGDERRLTDYGRPVGDHVTKEEQVMRDYERIQSQALQDMRRHSHEMEFSWRRLLTEGIQRRRSLDVELAHQQKAKPRRASQNQQQDWDDTDLVSLPTTEDHPVSDRESVDDGFEK